MNVMGQANQFLAGSVRRLKKSLVVVTIVLGSIMSGIGAAYFSKQYQLSPDAFGAVLAAISGTLGLVGASFDKRLGEIRSPNTPDTSVKKITQEIKRDTDACAVAVAVFGLPAILSRIYTPASGPHALGAVLATISLFVLYYMVVLKYRASRAELKRA
jgi:hypothetical protein